MKQINGLANIGPDIESGRSVREQVVQVGRQVQALDAAGSNNDDGRAPSVQQGSDLRMESLPE